MDLGSFSDADLLKRWCAGEKVAGEELTNRHFTHLRSYVRRKLDDRAAVDEIVQETWLAILKGREKIRDGAKFRGYLNIIASRNVFRWLRRRRMDVELDPEQTSISQASATLHVQKSDTKLLYRALRELPLDEQLTLELVCWEDLTAQDIADLMDVSLATVKHRLRRGREKLTAEVERLAKQPGNSAENTQELLAWFADLKRRAAELDGDDADDDEGDEEDPK